MIQEEQQKGTALRTVFLARQPIFDRNTKIIAYELLFRSDPHNAANEKSRSTASLVVNALGVMGLAAVSVDQLIFVNMEMEDLIEDLVEVLPP